MRPHCGSNGPHFGPNGASLGPHWGPNEVPMRPQWGPNEAPVGPNEAPMGPWAPMRLYWVLIGASLGPQPQWGFIGPPLAPQWGPIEAPMYNCMFYALYYNHMIWFSTMSISNQRVICLSVTSETRHDTRDQRESLRGRAPRPYSGQISLNFGENMYTLILFICSITHINSSHQ